MPAPHTLLPARTSSPADARSPTTWASGEAKTQRYWRFELRPDLNHAEADEDVLAEELRALLSQAVERRLISDVPLGLFLSAA